MSAFVVLLCVSVARAEEPTVETVTETEIVQWITQLDDDRFDARQRAQQQLEHAGEFALQAVSEEAQAGSLESATRAINILLHWTEAKEQELRLGALEKLANLAHRPRESAAASRLLIEAREKAALDALTQLGAEYLPDRHTRTIGKLQVVFGPKWTGGNEGLKHLADVPRAVTVSLHATPVDDRALGHLTQLPNLLRVEIYGTKLSQATVDKFKERVPNVDVDYRLGALLGVHGNTGDRRITSVEPKSAAAKAGIKPGDRITQFNGEAVTDFKSLTKKISGHQPGDSAELTVLRQDKTFKVKVTFGNWAEANLVQQAQQQKLRIQNQIILPPARIELQRR